VARYSFLYWDRFPALALLPDLPLEQMTLQTTECSLLRQLQRFNEADFSASLGDIGPAGALFLLRNICVCFEAYLYSERVSASSLVFCSVATDFTHYRRGVLLPHWTRANVTRDIFSRQPYWRKVPYVQQGLWYGYFGPHCVLKIECLMTFHWWSKKSVTVWC
jgi:hypothetical protein